MYKIIDEIKEFEQDYQFHHNRIKKIVIVSFIQFIVFQKKMISNKSEADYLKRTTHLMESDYFHDTHDINN